MKTTDAPTKGVSEDSTDAEPDDCDDCAELPDDWPCATCYINGEKAELPEVAH